MDVRPIDANAMHKFVEDKVAEGKEGWENGVPYEWAYALTAVDMQPTLDYAPVRHGEWVGLEFDGYADGCPVYDLWECSECKGEHKGEYDTLTDYCPHCGAKMDGGKQHDAP